MTPLVLALDLIAAATALLMVYLLALGSARRAAPRTRLK